VTSIRFNLNENSAPERWYEVLGRNTRFRCLFLFDARQMLLSVLCADECGVSWPYFANEYEKYGSLGGRRCCRELCGDGSKPHAPDQIEAIRVEFAAVVEERRRRAETSNLG
jgi:hypothetical protein